MRIQTSQKAELFAHALRMVILGVFAAFACAFLLTLLNPSLTDAATSSTINFQAKLQTSGGAIVPDGNYNVEFKIYNASSSSGSSQGSCSGDANCLWAETRVSGNQVRVANGYLTVNLGSVTAFAFTNWNQQLWLTMRIGGTGAPSWDTEMSPRILLTASPYAFQAGELGNGTNRAVLDGSGNLQLYQTSTIGIIQNPSAGNGLQLTVKGGDANTANNIGGNLLLQGGAGVGTGASGSVVVKSNTNNSSTAFQIQNASSSVLFNADTTNMRLGVDVTFAALAAPSGLAKTNTTGTLTAGNTFRYEVTAIDAAGGETAVSNELSGVTGATGYNLTWSAVTGAYAYRVYRTANGGGSGSEKFLASSLTNSYTDNGTAVLTGTSVPISTQTAYSSTNVSNKSLQLSIGGNGKATGQVYVSGQVPSGVLSTVKLGGNFFDAIAVQGRYAYVGGSGDTLDIFDVSNPAAPVKVSTGSADGDVYALAVSGHYLYAVGFFNNLDVFDISNPASPTVVSRLPITTSGAQIVVQGRYAYIADDSAWYVIDIANPLSPVIVSSTSVGASGADFIAAQGKYVYVSGSFGTTLRIYDVSNPASPVAGGTVSLSFVQAFTVQGRYLYLADNSSNALDVYDVSNPASAPTLVGSAAGMTGANDVVVQGRYAYVVANGSNPYIMGIYDISNPQSPSLLGTVNGSGNTVFDLAVSGRYLYTMAGASPILDVFDLGGAYIQQLEVGGLEASNLSVTGNSTLFGDETLQGGLTVGQSVGVNGNLGVGGQALFANSSNSAASFQIQNASNDALFNVDTTTANKITNSTFESVTTGWAATGTGASIARNITQSNSYNGYSSLQVTTGTTANSGARVSTFTATLTPATYNLSFYAKASSSFTDLAVTATGGTVTCTLNSNTVSTSGFQRYSCSFTSSGSNITNITIGESGTTSHVFYLDAVQLTSGATTLLPYQNGALQLNGLVNSALIVQPAAASTSAFQVQNASAASILTVDTINTAIVLGNDGATSAFTVRGGAATGTDVVGSNITFDASNGTGAGGSGDIIFRTASGGGIPTQDTVSTVQHNASTSSLTWSHTVNNQSNRLLVVGVTTTSATVSTVKYGGVSLTRLSQVTNGGGSLHNEIWYLVAPAVGTGSIVVTFSGTDAVIADSVSYYNTNQGTPFGAAVTNTGNSVSAAVTVTGTSSSNVVFSNFSFKAITGFWTPSNSQLWYDGTSEGGAASAGIGGSPNTTVTWTNSSSGEQWALIAAAINPAAGSSSSSDSLADRLHITASGNVGIGVASPQSTLDVSGTASFKIGATSAFQVQNASGNALLNADTTNMRVGVNTSYTLMGTPSISSATAVTTAGSLSGTYRYKISAIDSAGGETALSAETAGVVVNGTTNHSVSLSWAAVTGASGYRIYRTNNVGTTNTEFYLTTTLTNSLTDTGAITLSSTSPQLSSTLAYTSTSVSSSSLQFSVGGNGTPTGQLYVSGNVPTTALSTTAAGSGAYGVAIQGRYAYVTNNTGNTLQIFDISNPASPVSLSTLTTNGTNPFVPTIAGHYAYIVNNATATLQIVDISNPLSPTQVSLTTTSLGPRSVSVQGRYAYIANSNGANVQILDISNPAAPVGVGVVSATGPLGIDVQGRYAYVVNFGASTMQVFDVSNPNSPAAVGGSTATGSNPVSVYVRGRYAYVTDRGANALQIFDVSNPASPVSVSTVTTGTLPQFAAIQGRYAYVANGTSGNFQTIDISNPAAPFVVGTVTTGSGPRGIAIQGRYAYVANTTDNTLQVFDLGGAYVQQLEAGGAELANLSVTGGVNLASDVAIQGGLAVGQSLDVNANFAVKGTALIQGAASIVGGIQGGLVITNIATPSTPTVTPRGTTGGATYSYKITALSANGGETLASTQGTTNTGNASLTTTNYNEITWSSVPGAINYKIYRSAGTGGNGLIGTTGNLIFLDTGIAGGAAVPTSDTTGNLILGVASSANGTLVFNDSSNANTVTLVAGATGASYSLTLPTTGPATSQCLQTDSVTASLLKFGSCSGAGSTLSGAYNNGTTSSDQTILLATAKGSGIIIKDNATPLGTSLFSVQDSGGSTKYLDVAASTVTIQGGIVQSSTTTSGNINSFTDTALNTSGASVVNITFANTKNAAPGASVSGLTITANAPSSASAGSNTTSLINLSAPSFGNTQNFNQNLNGILLSNPGALTTTGVNSSNIIWNGLNLTSASATPGGSSSSITTNVASFTIGDITQTSGAVASNGLAISTGNITTGGSESGINIAASGVAAGTLQGINISAISGGTGSETAFSIGSGWDTQIQGTGFTVGTAGATGINVSSSTALQVQNAGTYALTVDTSTSRVAVGQASAAATLDVLTGAATVGLNLAGTALASAGGANGANASNILTVVGTAGQADSGTGFTAGSGSAVSITSGAGGANTGASGTPTAGAAGNITLQGGSGGAANSTVNGIGGAGGSITIQAGGGGAGGVTGTGGAGGTVTIQAGDGGATGGFASPGNIILQAGSSAANSASGSVTVRNVTNNSTTAFQVQNTINSNALLVDTTTLNNFITNGNFEGSSVSSWTAKGTAAAPTRDTTTTPYIGLASLTDVAGTASGNGIKYTTVLSAVTYALSFSVRQLSGTALTSANFEIGWNNGTTDTACTGLTPSLASQAPSTTAWVRYTCTFTGSASGHIYWKLSAAVGSSVTFNIDAVQLEQASGSTGYAETSLSLNGIVESPLTVQNRVDSNAALNVFNSAGKSLLVVSTLNLQVKIGIGSVGEATPSLLVVDTDSDAAFSAGSATNSSTEVDGAIFYSSTNHAFMCGVAGSWETCSGLLYSNTANGSASNTCTTACTNLANAPIPANYCKAGRVINIQASGTWGDTTTAPTTALEIRYGTSTTRLTDTLIGSASPTFTPTPTSASGLAWNLRYTIICFSTTSMSGSGTLVFQNNASNNLTTSNVTLQMAPATTGSLTTTAAANLYLFPVFGTSNAANTMTMNQYTVIGN